jgi:hypothetical protein
MNWKLVLSGRGELDIDDWSDQDREEDLSVGYSMIREMAPEWQLREIAPGVWLQEKDES